MFRWVLWLLSLLLYWVTNFIMRTVFFGTSQYCLPVLEALKPQLKLVITREDKPVGRKQILTPSATKIWAQKNNIPVDVILAESRISDIDLAIIADYGKIIKHEIYEKPNLGTFNIHFSKLPDLRGPSPVQTTLLRGDKTAWITIYKLKFYPELKIKMDSGPILWQEEYPILPDDTTESLYTRLFLEVAKEIPVIFSNYESGITNQGKNLLVEQDHTKATFCSMLTKQDGFVEWSMIHDPKFMIPVYNRFRAMTPWPGLWTVIPSVYTARERSDSEGSHKNRRMKILKCHLEKNKLVLDEVQFEGKTPQKFSDKLI